MLKLTYTENDFCLERLVQPLDDWVNARVILALRAGISIYIEPSTASFLLPADLPLLADLETVIRQEQADTLSLSLCDAEYVEISLHGNWLATTSEAQEGIFVTAMSYRVEFFLDKLWQEAQSLASVVKE